MASCTCSPARVTGTATPMRGTVPKSKRLASTVTIRSPTAGSLGHRRPTFTAEAPLLSSTASSTWPAALPGLIRQLPPSTSTTQRRTPGTPWLPSLRAESLGGSLNGLFYVVAPSRTYAYNRVTNQRQIKAAPQISGSVVRVGLGAAFYLFTATANQSALYTP